MSYLFHFQIHRAFNWKKWIPRINTEESPLQPTILIKQNQQELSQIKIKRLWTLWAKLEWETGADGLIIVDNNAFKSYHFKTRDYRLENKLQISSAAYWQGTENTNKLW